MHKDHIALSTQEGYSYLLRTLNHSFGSWKLQDIKPYDIEVFLHHQRELGRADSTLAQLKGMLYQILHKAEANDLVRKNPVVFVDKIRKRVPRKEKDVFTAEEVRILMRELPDTRIGWSIRLLLGTGMRTQELLALEPRHIREDGSEINIEQAVYQVKGTVGVGPTKTNKSTRRVPIPPSLQECAKNLRKTENKFIWEEKKPNSPCNPSFFRDQFRNALVSIQGIRILTPHCCRHTFVSQMQALGVDVPTIQSIVGHAEIDMTEYYLHVQDSVKKAASEKFSRQFGEGRDPI